MPRPSRIGLFAALVLAGLTGCPKRAARPQAPPRVVLLRPEPLRAAGNDSAENLVTLAKGETLEILKLADHWCRVRTLAGRQGWVQRESFSHRTLVVGSSSFFSLGWDVASIADRLRKIPEVDVVKVEAAGLLPESSLGLARQLTRGFDIQWVIVVTPSATGSGQLLFDVIDVDKDLVLGSGATARTVNALDTIDGLMGGITSVVHRLPPVSAGPGTSASPSPAPSSGPELPNPNAPLPAASPPATPTAVPSPSL